MLQFNKNEPAEQIDGLAFRADGGFSVGAVLPLANPFRNTLALFFFCAAGFTDFLDGQIARARGLITNFGILMDPLADKIMTCSAFVAFVESTHLHPDAPVKVAAWMVIIIVARELAITGLRLLAASKGVVLAAEGFGKHKTISQIVAIIALLVTEARNEWPARCKMFSRAGRCHLRKSCCG